MVVIIADDLTGASDTGVQYQINGFSTMVKVLLDNDDWKENLKKYEVLSINTDTRSLSCRDAYEKVYSLTRELGQLNIDYLYKKVDSIMRGNPAIELQAVMDGLGAEIALVAPSFPDNGRIIENGILYLPDNKKVDVTAIFNEETNKQACNISLADIRRGAEYLKEYILKRHHEGKEIFVLDAVNDEDLATIKTTSMLIDKNKVLCGSAGLARHLSNERKMNQPREDQEKDNNTISMVVVGSRSVKTAEQVERIADTFGAPIILVDADEIKSGRAEAVKVQCIQEITQCCENGEKLLIIAVTSLFKEYAVTLRSSEEENSQALLIARVLGEIVHQAYDIVRPQTIVSTGGDTSLQICSVLKAQGIELEDEITAGVPIGRIIGGKAHNTSIVTKSGGFGEKNVLVEVIEYLNRKEKVLEGC